jgi:hypothetical protein
MASNSFSCGPVAAEGELNGFGNKFIARAHSSVSPHAEAAMTLPVAEPFLGADFTPTPSTFQRRSF